MTTKEKIINALTQEYEYWREKEHDRHSIESETRMSESHKLLLEITAILNDPNNE